MDFFGFGDLEGTDLKVNPTISSRDGKKLYEIKEKFNSSTLLSLIRPYYFNCICQLIISIIVILN